MLNDVSGLGDATPEFLDRWTATQAAPKAPQRKRPCRSRALSLILRSSVELRVREPRPGARSALKAEEFRRLAEECRATAQTLSTEQAEPKCWRWPMCATVWRLTTPLMFRKQGRW